MIKSGFGNIKVCVEEHCTLTTFFAVICALMFLQGNAFAQVFTLTGAGTWGSTVPTTTWTAPNSPWQFSLTISPAPLSVTGCSGIPFGSAGPTDPGFNVYFTNFTYSLNGISINTCPRF